jgi:RNA polymerase sigma factor (sigma-70 family)
MEGDISEITLKYILTGDETTLASLIEHPEMIQILNEASAWAGWRYQQDKEDLRQTLLLMICIKLRTLSNPRHLKSWCYSTVKNYCLNEVRHRRVVNSSLDEMKRQSHQGKRHKGKSMVQSTAVLTPEQELLLKEEQLRAQEAFRKIAPLFSKQLAYGWKERKTVKQISDEIGKSEKTIYAQTKKMLKAIVKEAGIESDGNKNDS